MATSKTLTPTNITISIPAMTDAPDQRVNSNCIDKEADAINALSDQIANLFYQTSAFSVSPNSYTEIDYPTGYTKDNTRIISCVIANYYIDYRVISFELKPTKIKINNSGEQNWTNVKLLLCKAP